jgi:hypothetical protein
MAYDESAARAEAEANRRKNERLSLERGYRDRLTDLVEYTGKTWDEAVDSVLAIMETQGRAAVDAIGVYAVRHEEKVRKSVKTRTTQKITSYRIPKAVLDVALDLADGDRTRLRISEDGTITVVNKGKGEK